jgi:hypothetical protein
MTLKSWQEDKLAGRHVESAARSASSASRIQSPG